jgi:hypothetical protein
MVIIRNMLFFCCNLSYCNLNYCNLHIIIVSDNNNISGDIIGNITYGTKINFN